MAPLHINWQEVDRLLSIGCTGIEIASTLGCVADTLYRRVREEFGIDFVDYKAQKQAVGHAQLREWQTKSAVSGSVPMQIWLGKQWLGQSDRLDQTSNGKTVGQINIVVKDTATEKALTDVLNEVGGRNQNDGDVPQATPGD